MRPDGQTTAEFPLLRGGSARILWLLLCRSATNGGRKMPAQRWSFRCGCHKESVQLTVSTCNRCGAPGVYEGWDLRMFESMSAYSRAYGLKPIGSHRPYADKVMMPLFRRCEICRSRGVIALPDDDTCCFCPLCDGTGRVSNVSRELLERARRQVLSVYPDAGIDW